MKKFYHGSINSNLKQLEVISKCNENPNIKCAYITDNYAYSLFYVRDMDINLVTAWVNKDGIVCYEEQFENQLEIMYKNQSGYIYSCEDDNEFIKSETNGIYYSKKPIVLTEKEYISDAYSKIQQQIKSGNIEIKYYKDNSKERLNFLYEGIKLKILKNNFFENNEKLINFYKTHYEKSWNMALLENAIKNLEATLRKQDKSKFSCIECENQHKQILNWLVELRDYENGNVGNNLEDSAMSGYISLDEAIEHTKDVVNFAENDKIKREHEELLNYLQKLKMYRNSQKK